MMQAAIRTDVPTSETKGTMLCPGPITLACRHTPAKYSIPVPAGVQIPLPHLPKKIYCVSRDFSQKKIAGTDMETGKGIIIQVVLQDLSVPGEKKSLPAPPRSPPGLCPHCLESPALQPAPGSPAMLPA